MNNKDIKELISHYRIFNNIIEHSRVLDILSNLEIKEKNDIFTISKQLKEYPINSLIEGTVLKAFNEFIQFSINTLSDKQLDYKNNHYFMDSMLVKLKENKYWNIYLSGCYHRFKDINRNNITLIRDFFSKKSSFDDYIDKFVYANNTSSWNNIPRTTLISDYTEYLLNVHKIEQDFLELTKSSNLKLDILSKENRYVIFKYAALSNIRNPSILNISFKYMYEYFNTLTKNSSLYDYLALKFCFHIISYTTYVNYLKNYKRNFNLEIINSSFNLICSDHQLNFLPDLGQRMYSLTFNKNSFAVLYEKDKSYSISEKRIVEIYEENNILQNCETLFIPERYNINDIKKIFNKNILIFKNKLISSIDPYIFWQDIDDNEKKYPIIIENVDVNELWLKGYFFKDIKETCLYFDRKIIKQQVLLSVDKKKN